MPADPQTVYLLRSDHPQIRLTWASKFPAKVDKLKLRKRINLFPVRVTLMADYDTNTREFEYGCSAKASRRRKPARAARSAGQLRQWALALGHLH